jgi:hypothetical protein
MPLLYDGVLCTILLTICPVIRRVLRGSVGRRVRQHVPPS